MAHLDIVMSVAFYELKEMVWSGAKSTLDIVEHFEKEDELMDLLGNMFEESTMTDINDYLWHDSQHVFEMLGINEEEYWESL